MGDQETLDGSTFRDGELAFVAELHLMSNGGVTATVRTLDGRKMIVFREGDFTPA